MQVEIVPVGGYSDFGRNMTCVRIGREAVILDMGMKLDRIMIHEDAVFDDMHPLDLQKLGAIPDDSVLKDLGAKVVAIVLGHGHLDHVGAVAKLAGHYGCPIYATPYTCGLVEDMVTPFGQRGGRGTGGGRGGRGGGRGAAEAEAHGGPADRDRHERGQGRGGRSPKRLIPNRIVPLKAGETVDLSKEIRLEFVHSTHSIVQTVFPVLHTRHGAIVYAVDYKFDNTPILGAPPDYRRLRQLATEGVLACIVESTNASKETKTPSEAIARDMLRDYLFGLDNERVGLVVSTYSSHQARIKSICEFAEEMGREVLLMGRSMEKYQTIAQDLGILKLPANVRVAGYGRAVEAAMKQAQRDKRRYLLLATGHQGEPGSLLQRMASNETPWRFEKDDQVIFSADIIPHPLNVANRYALETKLKMQQARIIKGAHVSGHACREDHRELLAMLEPQHIFPCHGGIEMQSEFVEIGERQGHKLNKTLHILRNGDRYALHA